MALTVLYETLFIPLGNFQQRTTENGMCPVISQGKENCMVLTDSASEWKLEYQILSVTVFSVRRHSQVSSRSAATWQAASGFALSWTAPGPVWNGHRRLSGISSGITERLKRLRALPSISSNNGHRRKIKLLHFDASANFYLRWFACLEFQQQWCWTGLFWTYTPFFLMWPNVH